MYPRTFQRPESVTFILRMSGLHSAAAEVFRRPANDLRGRPSFLVWLACSLAVCALAASTRPLDAQQAQPQTPAAETQQPAAESPQPTPQQSRFRRLIQKPNIHLPRRPSTQKPAVETPPSSTQQPSPEAKQPSLQTPSTETKQPETPQTSPQTPAAETKQPVLQQMQEPGIGAGEQVHTGTTSGLDTDARLTKYFAEL